MSVAGKYRYGNILNCKRAGRVVFAVQRAKLEQDST